MAKWTWKAATDRLRSSPKNIRCSELKKMLEDMGFDVRKCGGGNHRAYSHPEIPGFAGGDYDCGHGGDAQIKPAYIRNVIGVLEEFERELRAREP
jgi:hypothetical protein